MKVLIFTDPHFCQFSSIVRSLGKRYSLRLENQLQSINWVERLAEQEGCSKVICAGDFFDQPVLNENELSALKEISWSNIPHTFIVGNHEVRSRDLSYSSTKALNLPQFNIIDSVYHEFLEDSKTVLTYLPYIVEEDRKPFAEYMYQGATKQLVISHNDLKGISYGPIESKEGFELSEIASACDLFINGHIHNGQFLNKEHTILNLGNLTGQNSCEDATLYSHNVIIVDTTTLEYKIIENPFAFNFYKLLITSKEDFKKVMDLKSNAVVVFKCEASLIDELKAEVAKISTIVEKRFIIYRDEAIEGKIDTESLQLNKIDHLQLFVSVCHEKFGESDIVNEELAAITATGGTI